MRLCFVLGTAAELIKVYPLMKEAEARGFDWMALSSGQSPVNMEKQYADFDLPDSKLIRAVHSINDLDRSTSALKWFLRALVRYPRMVAEYKPDFIVVHGDTLTTLIGALWGRRLKIPVVHIEAGLRSTKLFSPFPEEINRRLVSKLATYHMAPDDVAAENLRQSRVKGQVFTTGGNTLIDSVRLILSAARVDTQPEPFVLANLHRYENLNSDERWAFLMRTVTLAARKNKVRMVMHPQTQKKLEDNPEHANHLRNLGVQLEKRLPFSQFIHLLFQARYVITDGGSNQEECYYLGLPCLILRETTERGEGLHSTCVLARFEREIVEDFISNPERWRRPPATPSWSPSAIILDSLHAAVRKSA